MKRIGKKQDESIMKKKDEKKKNKQGKKTLQSPFAEIAEWKKWPK